jgi:hypothetical protein
MMVFTVEEQALISSMIWPVKISRAALIRKLLRCRNSYDGEILDIMNQVIRKLSDMTDEAYDAMELDVSTE